MNVHKPKKVSVSEDGEDDLEAKIYAISSEGGNVIYHVNQGKNKPTSKSSQDLKSYAMTVVNNNGAPSTAPARTHSVTDLSFERIDPESVKLRVNPFGSESSLDKLIFDGYDFPQSTSMPNLKGVKRLTSDTCRKEGIFFDGSDNVNGVEDLTPDFDSMHAEERKKSPEEDINVTNSSNVHDKNTAAISTGFEYHEEMVGDNLDELSSEDIAGLILEDLITSVVNPPPQQTNDTEVLSYDVGALAQSTLSASDFYSKSFEDLRKLDLESTSGSEYGDSNINVSGSGSGSGGRMNNGNMSMNHRLAYSTGNLKKSESADSFPSARDSPHMFDHREMDPSTDIHELHMHMLLYTQQYDYRRTMYALSTIRAMLLNCPRLVVTAMATTSISSVKPPHLAKLQALLGW